jgi:hypothetical protein
MDLELIEFLNKNLEHYILGAKEGNATAQNDLGYCYHHGIGVEQNLNRAIELYTLSAEQGNSDAQNNLGLCYRKGICVEKNLNLAIELYNKSIKQGNSNAQFNLGICYYNGIGVEKNLNFAIELFLKSSEQGDSDAKDALKKIGVNFQLFDVNDECVICLEKFDNANLCISLVPCNHYFHSKCLLKNYILNNFCPICKQNINNIKDIELSN